MLGLFYMNQDIAFDLVFEYSDGRHLIELNFMGEIFSLIVETFGMFPVFQGRQIVDARVRLGRPRFDARSR